MANKGTGKISLNLGGLKLASKPHEEFKEVPSTSTSASEKGSMGSFGKISFESPTQSKPEEDNVDLVADTDPDMARLMGFTGFGDSKKAKQFDMAKILGEARDKAKERNAANNLQLEEQGLSVIKGTAPTTSASEAGRVASKRPLDKTPAAAAPPAPKEKDAGSSSSDDEFIGPPIPAGHTENKDVESSDEESEDTDDDEDNLVKKLPTSHECQMNHGDRPVTALAIDPSGARLVSGGIDYEVKFWDFAGMDANMRNFRSIKPCESHVIRSLEYSSTGDKILVVAASSQAKVLDRDGHQLLECIKGDPYVIDVGRNKGHVGPLTSGCWHPKIKDEFLTASDDNSLRIWLAENKGRTSSHVIKTKSKKSGLKTIPTACTFSRDGLLVAAACVDGSIQMWDHRKTFVNVSLQLQDAHQKGSVTSSIAFAYDNRHMATRGGDDTLKLWDIRSFKAPLRTATGLFSLFDMTECCFSPDDRMIVTATSMEKGESSGKLVFFNRDTFERVSEIEIGKSHVIRALWHPRLNQIMVGSGDGIVRVYYDPLKSVNGAKLCVVRTKIKAKQTTYMATQQIITPYSLPMFKEDRQRSTRRQAEKARKDPIKSKRPDLPLGVKGTGGRVTSGGSTLHSWMAKQISVKNKDDHIDPRERILRHAKDSAENPYWIDPAYKNTQPKPVFQDTTGEEPPEKLTKTETFGWLLCIFITNFLLNIIL